MGIPRVADYNGPEQDGVSMFQGTQSNGRRWSAADGYLRPVLTRDNLEVVTGALVLGLELDGTRVSGVRYRDRLRRTRTIRPEREVILAAGAIGSPQLLLLSGIGPADHLREVGVPVRHELGGVGLNLQDHPFVTLIWDTLYGADKPKPMAEWVLRRSGPLTSSVAEVVAFVRTRPGLPAADVQFHGRRLLRGSRGRDFDGHAGVIAPVLVSPQARGRVWLRSDDPTAKPRILTNTLSEPDDVASLVAGMELAREIAGQPALGSVILRELKPGPDTVGREELEADLRRRLMLIYHPVGTCRMSDSGQDAVVDSQLRVHALEGVRVVDASVMPVIPGGNTNAPTIMIAERAADLIRGRAPLGTPAPVASPG